MSSILLLYMKLEVCLLHYLTIYISDISLADIRKTSPHDILSRLSINVWDTPDGGLSLFPLISLLVYVICHRGNDSQLAVEILKEKLKGCHIRDIRGGYEAWAKEVDKNFPLY